MGTKTISFRISEKVSAKLVRLSKRLGRSTSEITARWVEEGLVQEDYAFIDFRTVMGERLAYVSGTRIPVWYVSHLADVLGGKIDKIKDCLSWPQAKVTAALNYARDFKDEIRWLKEDSRRIGTFDELQKQLPGLIRFSGKGTRTPRRRANASSAR